MDTNKKELLLNHIDTILTTLGRLDDTYGNPDLMFQTESECLATLIDIDEQCSDAFVQVAQDLFQKIGEIEDAGYKFQLVLYVMMQRNHPDALDMVIDAVESDKIRDKGAMIDLLEDVNDRRLIHVMINVIQKDAQDIDKDDPDELGGEVRVKSINLLKQLQAHEASDFVETCLDDPAYMVRESAVQFLVSMNHRSSANHFLKRIEIENYSSILIAMIAALARWEYKEVLPVLHSLLGKAKAEKNPRLKEAIRAAISKLERTS
ncbi:MAG: hypothetical protein OHK0022_23660 [Roseiflexaceae bacterium]